MNLADLVRPSRYERTINNVKVKVASSQYVNPDACKPLGIIKVFEPNIFPPDSRPPQIRSSIITTKDSNAWIIAFLSKNPHFKYIQTTLSQWSSGRKYWFLNTVTNVKVVKTFAEITMGVEKNIAKDYRFDFEDDCKL